MFAFRASHPIAILICVSALTLSVFILVINQPCPAPTYLRTLLPHKLTIAKFISQVFYKKAPPPVNSNKIILLWNDYFSDYNWTSHINDIGGHEIRLAPSDAYPFNRTCTLTRDRSLLENASAVIFHGRNFDFNDLPKTRLPNQRWVFFLLESPHHSHFENDQWRRASQLGFNWTMYYTYASNLRFAYGYISPVNYSEAQLAVINERLTLFAQTFSARPYDAIWIVSNCNAPSRRMEIVNKMMSAGLYVDTWGGCFGRRPEKVWEKIGKEVFFSQYRFQFALENSICDDYATEKLFDAASNNQLYGLIPVVLGGANYSEIFRPSSFIDLGERGSTLQETTSLLRRLGQPNQFEKVRKYFEWQLKFTVEEKPWKLINWHAFCEKISSDTESTSIINDIQKPLGKCHEDEMPYNMIMN